MHTQVTAFFAEAERLRAQALALPWGWVHTQVLRAQDKDALQRLQQLCRETPLVRRDRRDPDRGDPEMAPEDGP